MLWILACARMTKGGNDIFTRGLPTAISLLVHGVVLSYLFQQSYEIPGNTELPIVNVIFEVPQEPQQEVLRAQEKPREIKKRAPQIAKAIHKEAKPIAVVNVDLTPSAQPVAPPISNSPPQYQKGSSQNPLPDYPYVSRRRGEEGIVTCEVKVAPNGKPEAVTVKESSGFSRLDEAATQALSGWIFTPALHGPDKIYGFVEISITFLLTEGVKI